MSYIGIGPKEDIVTNTHEYIVPVKGQQEFSVVYDDYVEVFVNGVQLESSLFIATNGISVTVIPTLSEGDIVKVQGFESFKNNNYYDKNEIDTNFSSKTEVNSLLNNKANTSLSNVTDIAVLNKIKNVDGVGSGLDADLLDGHDSSYFLPTSTYNATDILNKIKTVDGIGSGLDADTVDGKHLLDISCLDLKTDYSIGLSLNFTNAVPTTLVEANKPIPHGAYMFDIMIHTAGYGGAVYDWHLVGTFTLGVDSNSAGSVYSIPFAQGGHAANGRTFGLRLLMDGDNTNTLYNKLQLTINGESSTGSTVNMRFKRIF